MIDTIKEKISEHKYELIGFVVLLLATGIYKFYYPGLDEIIKEKVPKSEKTTIVDDTMKNQIKSLSLQLLKTEKKLKKVQEEINHKQELSMYENSQYNFNRTTKKILILKWNNNGDHKTINEPLQEPFKIDKLSDVYLDNFTTMYGSTTSPTFTHSNPEYIAYILKIDQFKNDSNSNESALYNSIVIPNEYATTTTTDTGRKTHKGKKLNYICSINPCNITELTGTITNTNGTQIFNNANDSFIAEFIFVARDK